MRRRLVLSLTVAAYLLLVLSAASSAIAAPSPEWKLTITPSADYFLSGHYGVYKVEAENVGTAPTKKAQPIKLENIPPSGTAAERVGFFDLAISKSTTQNFDLADSPFSVCPSAAVCEWPSGPLAESLPALPRQKKFVMTVLVAVPSSTSGALEDVAKISGGGAPPAEASVTNHAAPQPVFGDLGFESSLTDSAAEPYTQAGGHPSQFTTEFNFGTYSNAAPDVGESWVRSGTEPAGDPREIVTELPPGLVANPQGVPHCALAAFYNQECDPDTQVGVLGARLFGFTEGALHDLLPVYNLQPTGAYPGELGATVAGLPLVLITAGVRTGGDYGVTANSTAAEAGLNRVRLTLWGVPADPSHDPQRPPGPLAGTCSVVGDEVEFVSAAEFESSCESRFVPHSAEVEPTPFITMPTQCSVGSLEILGRYNTWEGPEEFAQGSVPFPAVNGCNAVAFEPTIEARPTSNLPDSPSGLDFDLHIPNNGLHDPNALGEANVKDAVAVLPRGLTVNPSASAGLTGCAPDQIEMHSNNAGHCPESSKIGTVEVESPLLHSTLEGGIFEAIPGDNPFGSTLAFYIVVQGEGLIIKLAAKVVPDPATGQLTTILLDNPQLPFEDFRLHLFGGARGVLRTPPTCGSYETTSTFTPYSAPESGPPAEPTSSFQLDNGGAPCPHQSSEEPNAPAFLAGTESTQAGAFTPFAFKLAREDGSQEIEKIETTLPSGLTAKLAGVAECSEAQIAVARSREHEGGGKEEEAQPSCPASSELGTVQVASGAGPTPLYVQGKAYLAGPYKGAPLSLAIITPAVAGPFDLGTVVVRTALYTAPYNAQIKAISDPIPHILQGIPLDVRSITLKMARPNFTLNPTNCEEMGFAGAETSLLGNVAPLAQRFQVGGCQALPFKPKLKISLKGGVKRATFPALTATLTMPPGQANIASAQVTLPHAEQLEQAHITSQVCTQPQLATQTCPKASIYGYAKAQTPLLDHPLEGPVYLGVGFGHELPDLVAELNGQIRVLLHGKVDTGREDGLRNTFEVVPDAPVSKFTLHMFGGKKSLIVNSQNLCAPRTKRKALARFTAQSGSAVELEPTVATSCKKHKKGKGHKKGRRAGGKRRA